MHEFINIKMIRPLVDKLIDLKNKRSKELARLGSEFGDPILLAKYYVQPNCQNGNPLEEEDFMPPITRPVFDFLNAFLKGEITARDGRGHLFILGDAGMGKTSLLLLLKFFHLTSFWPQKYDCEIYRLGSAALNEISEIKNPSKTILLLDALDEDPNAWNNYEDRIIEIIRKTVHFRQVIITCRTQFFPLGAKDPFQRSGFISIRGFTCPTVYLSLFDDEQVLEYLNKKLKTKDRIEKALIVIQKMGYLKFRPLLLAYIEDLLVGNIESNNIYEIYGALITAWLNREVAKSRDLNFLPLMNACLRAALFMQSEQKRYITELEIDKIKNNCPDIKKLRRFDIGGRSLLNKDSNGNFRFSHYSIEEFIIAKGTLENLYNYEDIRYLKFTTMSLDFIKAGNALSKYTYNSKGLETDIISGGIINDCNLYSLTFQHRVLVGVDYFNTSISQSVISKNVYNFSKAEKVSFNNCNFEKSSINECSLIQSSFDNCIFTDCEIVNTNFVNVIFKNCVFTNANLKNSLFSRCSLENCIFLGADMGRTSFDRHTDIKGSNFKGALHIPAEEIIKTQNWREAVFDDNYLKLLEEIVNNMSNKHQTDRFFADLY